VTLQDAYDTFVVWAAGRLTQHALTQGDLDTLRVAIRNVKDERLKVVAGTFFSGTRVHFNAPPTEESAAYDAARADDEGRAGAGSP